MYQNFQELLLLCKQQKCDIDDIVIQNEMRLTGRGRAEIESDMDAHHQVMLASAQKALDGPLEAPGLLIGGISSTQMRYANAAQPLCGSMISRLMARALSCSESNAAMGKICAAPTAGACGILPAVIITLAEERRLSHEEIRRALFTASGIGAVVLKNATVSGAEAGCQAECGVAAAMAAAAAAQLAGGEPEVCLSAAAHALINAMGLICDPVAGLVQIPCAQRNASQAVNALLSADLALAGTHSFAPLDEVVEAMYRVGRQLPKELRETAMGGLAATPSARRAEASLL